MISSVEWDYRIPLPLALMSSIKTRFECLFIMAVIGSNGLNHVIIAIRVHSTIICKK